MQKALVRIASFTFFAMYLASAPGQIVPFSGRDFDSNQLARFRAQFESGDTNAPLLAMDWFSRGDHFCRVSQSGSIVSALDVGYAVEGGHGGSLDAANKFLLIQAINHLPPSAGKSLPQERQIFVCGIRNNQWFQCTYDRADVPREVERLFEITGAYLEWFIPQVEGRPIGHSTNGNFHDSQAMINSFAVASDAPVAVSTGVNGLQIWDLSELSGGAILPLEKTPYRAGLGSDATLSPDGRVIVFTGDENQEEKTIYAFDWQAKEALWEAPQTDLGNTYGAGNRVFAIGNKGRSLFISKADCIEHWDMATGTKINTLTTNQTGIKFLQTSRDGTVLVAGFADHTFMVWRTDKDEPIGYFSEPEGATSMAVSPEGREIALSTDNPRGKLILWSVETKTQAEFPLRRPYAANSANSMYWSPDGKWLAAYVDTYPASIVVYETDTWKPMAHWPCGRVMASTQFGFRNDGVFLALRDHAISGLDTTKSEAVSGNKAQQLQMPKASAAGPKESPPLDDDLSDFQERVKQSVDPLRLQRAAIPVIAHWNSSDTMREYRPENTEFFQLARRIYGYTGADDYETKTNNSNTSYTPTALIITCSAQGYHHSMGLALGNKEFAGPNWNKRYRIVPWNKGVYFWEKIQEHSTVMQPLHPP